jgi:pyruvate/2-oxoglutarate dehydrogenase complex dihydrolipoamide dehydrogenase (E3) component
LITGNRVKIPQGGFPETGEEVQIELTNGDILTANMVIMATGQTPNNGLVAQLAESSGTSLVNPANGCIFVKPTLQLQSEKFPNIFSLGDIADTGSHKAARPGGDSSQSWFREYSLSSYESRAEADVHIEAQRYLPQSSSGRFRGGCDREG